MRVASLVLDGGGAKAPWSFPACETMLQGIILTMARPPRTIFTFGRPAAWRGLIYFRSCTDDQDGLALSALLLGFVYNLTKRRRSRSGLTTRTMVPPTSSLS